MSVRFKDKEIVITGGGSGIGLAAVKAFAAEGTIVAATFGRTPIGRIGQPEDQASAST